MIDCIVENYLNSFKNIIKCSNKLKKKNKRIF